MAFPVSKLFTFGPIWYATYDINRWFQHWKLLILLLVFKKFHLQGFITYGYIPYL